MRRRLSTAALLALTLASAPLAAQTLRGSQDAVDESFEHARDRGLTFHRTGRTVRRAAAAGQFVRLGGNANYRVAGVTFPYVLASTRAVVERLAAEYRDVCRERMTVTSAVRPSTRQPRNASDRSVHPTGLAVDLRKPRRSACRAWLRDRLLELEADGAVDATEEFRPPHFHLVVYKPSATRRRPLATAGDGGGSGSGTTQRR